MSTQNLIVFLAVGVFAGWLAGRIMKGRGFGLFGDLVVGVIGAFVGGWLSGLLGISTGGIVGLLVAALVGALVVLYLLRLVKKG